jgi:hypothetical protein
MKAMRGPVRGAASAEWLVVAPAVLAVGFGILQWAVLMHGRSSVEYAAFEGARAGATAHADPGAIVEGIATGLVAIRGTEITSIPVSASRAGAAALFRQELADGVAIWRQLRPRTEDFVDWAVPARDAEGMPLPGVVEIPNENLRFRGNDLGAASGRSLLEANVLEVELVYGWPMRVPLIGSLVVRWMEWFDGCEGGAAPETGSRPWGRAAWRIAGGGWRCPFYRAGGVPRWPIRVVARARMHTPARHAAAAEGNAAAAEGDRDGAGAVASAPAPVAPGPGSGPEQLPEGDDTGFGETGPELVGVIDDVSDDTPDGPEPAGAGAGSVDGSARPDRPPEVASVTGRADISQPGECFATSGEPEVDVRDEEAALAAAVEALAAESIAVEAR